MIILYLIFTQKKDYIDTHNPIGVGANKQKPLVAIRRVDVSPIGFEPMTASLEGRCSIQLSYEPVTLICRGGRIRTCGLHVPNVAR